MQIYLVGGAVRDALLGLPVKDRDWVVVGSMPEELVALASETGVFAVVVDPRRLPKAFESR